MRDTCDRTAEFLEEDRRERVSSGRQVATKRKTEKVPKEVRTDRRTEGRRQAALGGGAGKNQ